MTPRSNKPVLATAFGSDGIRPSAAAAAKPETFEVCRKARSHRFSKGGLKRRSRSKWAGEGGFTLMEVVTAVFIFLIGIVGVISLFAAAGMLHRGARDKTQVALAVEQVIAEIELKLESGTLNDHNGALKKEVEGDVLGYDRFRYRIHFDEEIPGRSMISAHLLLVWKEKGKERGEAFDVVFRRGPEFGSTVFKFRQEVKESKLRKVSGGG